MKPLMVSMLDVLIRSCKTALMFATDCSLCCSPDIPRKPFESSADTAAALLLPNVGSLGLVGGTGALVILEAMLAIQPDSLSRAR